MIGYLVILGNNPISWQSKKQSSVSRSSTEAEYKALAHTVAVLTWIRAILKDLEVFLPTPPVIHCDNMSAITLSANPVFHSKLNTWIRITTLFGRKCSKVIWKFPTFPLKTNLQIY